MDKNNNQGNVENIEVASTPTTGAWSAKKKRHNKAGYAVTDDTLLHKLSDAGLLSKLHGVHGTAPRTWYFDRDMDVKEIIDQFNAENKVSFSIDKDGNVNLSNGTLTIDGYSKEETDLLVDAAIFYKENGDEVDGIIDALNYIVCILKAFDMKPSNALSVVKKLINVGNHFSTTSGGIGKALYESASSLAETGDTLDESIASIIAANNVTQDPEAVGATLEIAAKNLHDINLREQVRALTCINDMDGFDIVAGNGTLKSTYDILYGISRVWDEMSDIDQAALLELIVDKRQSNVNAAILNEMLDEVADIDNELFSAINDVNTQLVELKSMTDSAVTKYKTISMRVHDANGVPITFENIDKMAGDNVRSLEKLAQWMEAGAENTYPQYKTIKMRVRKN